MRRLRLLPFVGLAIAACESTPPPQVATISIPRAPRREAPLVHVNGAHASIDGPRGEAPTWHHTFRSEGATAVLIGTEQGIVIVSAAHGVEGFAKPPSGRGAVRWAGFGKNDSVVIVVGTHLFRAASIADAVAGTFTELPSVVDPSLDRFASANDVFVAGASRGPYFESKDGGVTLVPATLPATDPLAQLVVRGDGLVVAAFEVGRKPGKYGGTTIHAQLWTKPRLSASWKKSALVESSDEPLTHTGDVVEGLLIDDNQRFDEDDAKSEALDAKGAFVRAEWSSPWLQVWPTGTFSPSPPQKRPKMPVPATQPVNDLSMLAGIGGLGARGSCATIDCIARRTPTGPEPLSYFLDDATCDESAVVMRSEEVHMADTGKTETTHWPACDENKPASRSATLVVPGAVAATHRLPASCSSGSLVGTDTWPIVQCKAEHGGKATVLGLRTDGSFAELFPYAGDTLESERASDGTTILSAGTDFFLCDAKASSCKPIAANGILAARPLDGDRALVARKTADAELALGVEGAEQRPLARVRVDESLLEMSITSDGNVRLWTHASAQSLDDARRDPKVRKGLHAWLVRADGVLVRDEDAKL